jgi:hypothetical protein
LFARLGHYLPRIKSPTVFSRLLNEEENVTSFASSRANNEKSFHAKKNHHDFPTRLDWSRTPQFTPLRLCSWNFHGQSAFKVRNDIHELQKSCCISATQNPLLPHFKSG